MAGRNWQVHLSTYVPCDVATAFQNWARRTEGGTAGALRRLIAQALDQTSEGQGLHGASPATQSIAPRGIGRGQQIGFRLRPTERAALDAAAREATMSPANWVRSLVLVHLEKRPQWNAVELDALQELFREVRAIGNNVNQIAHGINIALQTGRYEANQGEASHEAMELVRLEMRRIVSVMTGNFAYWGLPDAQQPGSAPGAIARGQI